LAVSGPFLFFFFSNEAERAKQAWKKSARSRASACHFAQAFGMLMNPVSRFQGRLLLSPAGIAQAAGTA
jgi:hypothetical protein